MGEPPETTTSDETSEALGASAVPSVKQSPIHRKSSVKQDAAGAIGEVRHPGLVWLLVPLTCHLYGYFWWYSAGHELREYLDREDIRPELDLVLALVTCGIYAFFVLPFRFGSLIREAQTKAGVPDAKNHGVGYCLSIFALYAGYGWMQKELNRVWVAAVKSAPEKDVGAGE